MNRVIIVHGYTGSPDKNWFPWLKKELEKINVTVTCQQFPKPGNPIKEEWVSLLDKLVGSDYEDTILVGHSLGCATIFRFLEQVPVNKSIKAAILVAGFAEPIGIKEIENFLIGGWDDKKIKDSSAKFVYYNSDDDPYVPIEAGKHLLKRFGGEFNIVNNAGHFNWRDGYTELPLVLEKIKDIKNK